MSMQPRFLFQIHNRRGLGHLMRGFNIAKEIRALAPSSEILFYVKCSPPEGFLNGHFGCHVASDSLWLSNWAPVVRHFAPHVIIYDTILPKNPASEHVGNAARYAYVMRQCDEAKQQEIFDNPLLPQIDLIVVPHTRAEFGWEVPPFLHDRISYVGPIVRGLDLMVQSRLKEKYGIRDGDFLLLSTVGGGGFANTAPEFFSAISEIHEVIHPRLPNLRHLVIQGPKFEQSVRALDGMTVIPYEPEIGNLIAISSLVISEGGYNTVHEIRLAKTPAIFLPTAKHYDDQEARVRELELRGLAFVYTDRSPATISQKILELAWSPSGLTEIKKRYADEQMVLGNRVAAEKILELVV